MENILRLVGGLVAYGTLVFLLFSIWQGTRRQAGRSSGTTPGCLRSPLFFLLASAIFFGGSYLGWQPLPWNVSPSARVVMWVIGAVVYFPGFLLLLWGRLALGKNYYVSTGLGAQLFADQQLITSGPYALMRHPMYLGLILASIGSLLIYFTWTSLAFACFSPAITLRARREEQALAAEFGEAWRVYCRRVPAFIPRLRLRSNNAGRVNLR